MWKNDNDNDEEASEESSFDIETEDDEITHTKLMSLHHSLWLQWLVLALNPILSKCSATSKTLKWQR